MYRSYLIYNFRSDTGTSSKSSESGSLSGVITGSVIGVIFIVSVAIMLLKCYRNKKANSQLNNRLPLTKQNPKTSEKMHVPNTWTQPTPWLQQGVPPPSQPTPWLQQGVPPPYQTIDPLHAQRPRPPVNQNWRMYQPPTLTKTWN